MKIINVTPHEIVLNNGTVFTPSGAVARVSAVFNSGKRCPVNAASAGQCVEAVDLGFCAQECLKTTYVINDAITCDCDECRNGGGCGHWLESSHIPLFRQTFGEITGLPDTAPDTIFIVSAIVLEAAKVAGRTDCVAPATGHKDVVRDDKGHIISVPGFVR